MICVISHPIYITITSLSFPQQTGHILARAIRSPASTTRRYERSSSSFSAGCANTLTAVRTSVSNSTTNGASGCRKPRKRTTRSVRTKLSSLWATYLDITVGTHDVGPVRFYVTHKKANQKICLFFWSIGSHLIAFPNSEASYNLQTLPQQRGNGQSK